jgi:diamine N-acetyltransferase
MVSSRGSSPLSYHRIGHAGIDVISDLELEPEQVEQYLGPIQDIKAAIRSGLAHALIGIKADGALVGFYVMHPDRRDNACWWLGWFALDRRQQGRGYGRTAMTQIMHNFHHIAGCRRIRLLVDPINKRAIHLYEQAGFRQVGTHRSGELIFEVVLSSVAAIENIIALLRASSASRRARRAGRLRLSPGPHAGLVIGVERGPPQAALGVARTSASTTGIALRRPLPRLGSTGSLRRHRGGQNDAAQLSSLATGRSVAGRAPP